MVDSPFVDTTYVSATVPVVFRSEMKSADAAGIRRTAPAKKDEEGLIDGSIVPWGDENDFPDQLRQLAEDSTIIGETLHKQVNLLYGRGVYPAKVVGIRKDGREILEPLTEQEAPQVFDFIFRSNLNRYLREAATDLYYCRNPFPELILSKNRKAIVQISEIEAIDARLELRDKRTGVSPRVHVNPDWVNFDSANSIKVPTINPYDPYRLEAIRNGRDFHYAYLASPPSFGRPYYAYPQWYSAKKSGWLDIAASIPLWKKSLMKNQIGIRYIIHVPDYWWKWKYKEWDSFSPDEQREKIQTEYKNAEKFLTGEANAGKILFTSYKFSEDLQKEYPGWRVEEVGNKWKDGMYIEDSHEASAHLLYAMGFDPTLVGFSPGKNHTSAGSGSDKRVAYNIYMAGIHPARDLILEPLNLLTRYNQQYAGWPKNLRWPSVYQSIETLDTGSETSPKTVS